MHNHFQLHGYWAVCMDGHLAVCIDGHWAVFIDGHLAVCIDGHWAVCIRNGSWFLKFQVELYYREHRYMIQNQKILVGYKY